MERAVDGRRRLAMFDYRARTSALELWKDFERSIEG